MKILILLLLLVILISGCVSSQPTCGNNKVEAGEECDNSTCSTGKVCTVSCKCETPTPPPLPT